MSEVGIPHGLPHRRARASAASAEIALTVALIGCGGGSGGADVCSSFSACGGEISGSWLGDSVCIEGGTDLLVDQAEAELPPACANSLTIEEMRPNTTLRVEPSGAFSESGVISISWVFRFNLPCISAFAQQSLTPEAVPEFCTQFQQGVANVEDSPFEDVVCGPSGNSCRCDAAQSEPVDAQGTYQSNGQSVTLSDGSNLDYCVRGNDLTLRTPDPVLGATVLLYTRQR